MGIWMAAEGVNELGGRLAGWRKRQSGSKQPKGWWWGRAAGWRQVEGLWDILTTSVSQVGMMVMDLQSRCV